MDLMQISDRGVVELMGQKFRMIAGIISFFSATTNTYEV